MGAEALYMLPISLLIGFLFFEYMIRSRWGGYALWLETIRERLSFYFWPRAPANIVRVTMLNGEQLLFYNVQVTERKDQVLIETPLGKLVAPEKAATAMPLTSIFLPGKPSPLSLVVFSVAGLVVAWLTYYYGYLLLGFEPDMVFATFALILMMYVYMYYTAASTNGVEYHEYEVRGLAPPFIHAIPSSNIIGPLRQARYNNTPILIRVSKSVGEALDTVKKALGVQDTSLAAELLALGEAYDVVVKKAVSLKVHAARVTEALGAFRALEVRFGRITVGKVALLFLVFIIGLAVGLALGGTDIVVGPPADTGYYPGAYPAPATTPSYTSTPTPAPATTTTPYPYPSPAPAAGGGAP